MDTKKRKPFQEIQKYIVDHSSFSFPQENLPLHCALLLDKTWRVHCNGTGPLRNERVLLHHYSILYELLTIKDAWKVQNQTQTGNRRRKSILEICFGLSSPRLFFSIPEQSPEDDQCKPFNEPGGCSPSLPNLKRDSDPNTGGIESRSYPSDP